MQLLEEGELVGTEPEQESLIEVYSGNPLALRFVRETIFDLFGGEIGPFLAGGTGIFGNVTSLLDEQFARLSAQEQSVLCWLAIMREPVTLDELQASQVNPLPRVQLLETVDAGYRRSLIERGQRSGSFTLQSVVLEYVTALLIVEGSREIQQGQLRRLVEHGLEQAHAKEYVRQTQELLLLSPLLTDLHRTFQERATGGWQEPHTVPTAPVEQQLLSLLNKLRGQENSAQGYGPANLVALLRLQRGNLSGLDFSKLCIRGAYLQGIEMQNTDLSGASIYDTVLTEAATATYVAAISLDGKWWATGGIQGKVRVWKGEGQTLHGIWQAHAHIVEALAFSPDGHLLASGATDGTIKIWNVQDGTLLWTDWHNWPYSLAFSPDSCLLASAGEDATVCLGTLRRGESCRH